MEVYGFMGNLGTGKNYIAEQILTKYLDPKPYMVMAFADHFKIHAISFDNLDYDKVYHTKDLETRKKLQQIGTEFGRDKCGPDIWCKVLLTWMKVYFERGIKRFIITDVRFENEAEFIKSLGGILFKIEAPDRNLKRLQQESNNNLEIIKELQNHRSEIFIKEYKKYDYLLDNSINNIDNIENDIKKIISKVSNYT